MNRARHITVCSIALASLMLASAVVQASAATIYPRKASIGVAVPVAGDFTLVEMPFDLRKGAVRKGVPQLRVANRKRFNKSALLVFGGVRKVGKQWVAGALILRPQGAKASASATTTVDLQIVGRSTTITSEDIIAHPNVLSEPRAITNLTATCSEAFESRVRRLAGSSSRAETRVFLSKYKPARAIDAACSEDSGSQNNAFRTALGFQPAATGAVDCRGSLDPVSGASAQRSASFSCIGTEFDRYILRGPADAQLTAVTPPSSPPASTCQLIQDGSMTVADCRPSVKIVSGQTLAGTNLTFAQPLANDAEIQVEVYLGGAALIDFLIAPR